MRFYDVLVPLAAGVIVVALALVVAPGRGPHPRPAGVGGWLAWAVGIGLLAAGTWVFGTAGHLQEEADLGAVAPWAALAVGACALLGALRPVLAASVLLRVAAGLVGIVAVLSGLTWVFDQDEWEVTGFGPLLGAVFLVAAPVTIAAYLLRWCVVPARPRPPAGTSVGDEGQLGHVDGQVAGGRPDAELGGRLDLPPDVGQGERTLG